MPRNRKNKDRPLWRPGSPGRCRRGRRKAGDFFVRPVRLSGWQFWGSVV